VEGKQVVVLAGGGVAHISGGVGTLMLYLMDEWARRADAFPVRVVDTRGAGGAVGAARQFLTALALVLRLGIGGRIGLVHAHMTVRGSVVRKSILCALAGLLGIPTILHMHGADFVPFFRTLGPGWKFALRAVLRRASTVVVLGAAWRDFLVNEVGAQPGRVAVVLNGVPRPGTGSAGKAADAPAHLLFLGRLGERKGVPELVEALASPALHSRGWVATIAGDGEVERFREIVAQSGLGNRIALPGWVDRATASGLLAAADILVLPSHHEAMPIAVLEAMAAGVTVVTIPVGAVPEILQDGVSTLLVPPGAPAALAQALARLLDDPAERRRLAAAGHRVFEERLDIGIVADRILDLYRAAMRLKRAPGFQANQCGSQSRSRSRSFSVG
jgi:glycosyltransferase involved in cell wall biosynthesis